METAIPATSSAALFGKGVFTTILILGGRPFQWEKHWVRLTRNARSLGVDVSEFSEELVQARLLRSVEQERTINGRARITLFDESPSTIWPSGAPAKTSLSIVIGGLRPISNNFRLARSPYTVNTRSPLAGIKSCNYLENILTLDEAKGRGFDEAVRINENGHVTSASMANLFWLKDGELFTPSLATGCLAGTTREFILENLVSHEVEAEAGELSSADAIFLTSAGLGVTEVAEFNGRELRPSDHAIKHILPWAN